MPVDENIFKELYEILTPFVPQGQQLTEETDMITMGIDLGAKNIKVVVLKDNKIIAQSNVLAGFDVTKSALEAIDLALKEAAIKKDDDRSRG